MTMKRQQKPTSRYYLIILFFCGYGTGLLGCEDHDMSTQNQDEDASKSYKNSESSTESGGDTDTDTDSDTDADADSDMDTDGDTDGDLPEKESDTDTNLQIEDKPGVETDTFPEIEPGQEGLFLNNNVAIIGDSIFDLSDGIRKYLAQRSNEKYRYYPINGAQLSGGLTTPIPKQYENGKKDGPIRTIIMDGGGNDVLIGGQIACRPYSDSCEDIINRSREAATALFDQMIADGVVNVVWLGYYYTKGIFAGADGQLEALDVGMAITEDLCESNEKLNCHFVDPRPEFAGKTGLIIVDGIHPSDEGSKILADLIWKKMQEEDIEQNEH